MCRISEGSTAGGVSPAANQPAVRTSGMGTLGLGRQAIVRGVERQSHEWQFGGHSPPDASSGQSARQGASPSADARPLS